MKFKNFVNSLVVFIVCLLMIFYENMLVTYSFADSLVYSSKFNEIYNLSNIYNEVVKILVDNQIENYNIGIDENKSQIVVELQDEDYDKMSEILKNKYGDMICLINSDLILTNTSIIDVFYIFILFVFLFFIIVIYLNKKTKNSLLVKSTNEVIVFLESNYKVSIIDRIENYKEIPNDSLYNKIKNKIEEVKDK